ncbi:MAG TPA: universal stress protein [Roseiflexaceae bacterium]|nr:universal stress protein [Roseiflexaceae bacterium]
MNMLIYLGSARPPSELLAFCAPIVQKVATGLTLLTGGGASARSLLEQAAAWLGVPSDLPLDLRDNGGDPRRALRAATNERDYDLVVCGRGRWSLLAPQHAAITRQLAPSALLVRGADQPPRRILLASSGDRHTLDHVRFVAQLAQPLGATVTVLHVLSQQSLLFHSCSGHDVNAKAFFGEQTPEVQILRLAADWLNDDGIPTQLMARTGPIIDTIVDELRAGCYDLLVIGEHCPTSGCDRILLRNMTNELVAASPRSVLVVKRNAEA